MTRSGNGPSPTGRTMYANIGTAEGIAHISSRRSGAEMSWVVSPAPTAAWGRSRIRATTCMRRFISRAPFLPIQQHADYKERRTQSLCKLGRKDDTSTAGGQPKEAMSAWESALIQRFE